MPRLAPSFFRKAHRISHNLIPLLRTCRDLESACNELRWLREHVAAQPTRNHEQRLRKLCADRGRGKPLQYILGTEFFGELELLCRPGVLIPRNETARSVAYLVDRLRSRDTAATKAHPPSPLRVLDLCTGSGCMSLLFHHLYTFPASSPSASTAIRAPHILGLDISPAALALARANLARVAPPTADIEFALADVLLSPTTSPHLELRANCGNWDIILANPPYISPRGFHRDTARSVRAFEPRLALVPPALPSLETTAANDPARVDEQQGDMFYPAILRVARDVGARIVLVEVADLAQAGRVAQMVVREGCWDGVEIWRDEPGAREMLRDGEAEKEELGGKVILQDGGEIIRVKGRGKGRSVICWRGEGGAWLS